MKQKLGWPALIACIAMLSSGCHCFHNCRDGHDPLGAIPPPAGTYLCQWQQLHAARADEDDLVLYEADWVNGTDRLGPAARKRLTRLAEYGFNAPIVLEESEDSGINRQRQLAVQTMLAEKGVEMPAESVIVGAPEALPMRGQEAEGLARSLTGGTSGQASRSITPFSGFRGGLRGGLGGGFNSF